MTTAWERTTKILATAALAAACALSIGCGPAPGYEQQEPRVPVGYSTQRNDPEPATSEELAARAQAAQQQADTQGEIAVGADDSEYTDTDPSALTEFKPVLDGHGQWVDDSTYGTVWVPAESEVGTDFVPYSTAGHWTYADDTNYVWVSDYSWGWAPFHYGRWVHVGPRGWVWIPGRTYSGAWVSWRTGPGYDYVGWAPLGPEWYWYNGYAVGWGYGYTPYYSYCHHGHLYDRQLGPYVVRGTAARDHESHTRPYVAATPSVVGGGRVAATPSVGGGAGGAGGRTPASPGVGAAGGAGVAGGGGARTAATARIGPRPSELGVRPDAVVAPPSDHAGLARAHALASPSSAVAQGAAPPAQVARRRMDRDVIATAPSPRGPGFDGRAPASSSRIDAAARAPQVQGVAPVPPRQSSSSFSDPSARASSNAGQPAFRSAPSVSSQPSFSQPSHSQPSFSQPSQPSFSQPSHSQPSFSQPSHSQPSISSSPPAFRSSPSVSSPPPSFRSSPSVSARSAPAPAFHPSAPSAPRPSTRSSAPAARSKR